jgi:hypoxanthine phosphoribosyltransferase|tara:strand:+ start:364 stop:816 length:453 start_codon:yes stop_codon:yes gene_type:complete
MEEKIKLTWEDVDFITNIVSESISKKNIKFDTIVALGRGGLIPGAILSYKLDVKNLQNLGINTRQEDGQYVETLIYQRPTITGNVLVVDDINDSGKTFEAVNSLIKSEYPDIGELLYCSLTTRYNTNFNENNISGKIINTSDWLVFPWDK